MLTYITLDAKCQQSPFFVWPSEAIIKLKMDFISLFAYIQLHTTQIHWIQLVEIQQQRNLMIHFFLPLVFLIKIEIVFMSC